MLYIFLDESGDLGFSNKSSRWFILTMALTGNHRKVEKCVKKVHGSLKKKYKRVAELHAYHADKITRKRILQLLSETEDLKILCIVLNKKKVHTDLQSQKNLLYNYTANILLDRLENRKIYNTQNKIQICIDQRETNKFLNENFKNYLNRNLIKKRSNNFEIRIRPS